MIHLPCLYPITDRASAGDRSHAELVSLLCLGGATLVQVREKAMTDRELFEAARDAVAAAVAGGARLILNDRVDVAALVNAAGVHVGGEDLPAAAARSILGKDAIIGFSAHGVEEAISAVSSMPLNYVALGPIFPTEHASVSRAALGVLAVERAASAIRIPLVAIGGMNLERAREVLQAGAASVAVLGDIMSNPDIPAAVAGYLALGG